MSAERRPPATEPSCELCGDTGWVAVSDEPGAPVRRCECHARGQAQRRLDAALIPPRYQHATLGNFDPLNATLEAAKVIAEDFVAAYPDVETGLLFEGPAGVGKTHLAMAILRQLITQRGVSGRFVDYRDLLRDIQDSYNPVSETSELEILRPVLNADLLLIDELGTRRPTDWVRDTVTQILNDRYRHQRITLITTNYCDDEDPSAPTLADRIGPYARSRLYEMCRVVSMRGQDFRRITGKGTVHGAKDRPFIAAGNARTSAPEAEEKPAHKTTS
ncbi:MAG: ATP-binding protein [Acidobacteriota bacterium]